MKKVLSIGILGAAQTAPRVIINPAKNIENICIFGIASRDKSKAEKFAQLYEIPNVFPDYNSLIECDVIDAVYIPLSNDLHTRWVIKAAQSKKHILVEKPICLRIEEFDAIEKVVNENKIYLLEAIMVQHHPWQKEIRKIIETKIYGKLQSIKTHFTYQLREKNKDSYRFFPEKGGGVFFDNGPYWIQFVQSCIGLEPKSFEGISNFNGPNGTDWNFEGRMVFSDGVYAEFLASYELPYEAIHWLQFEKIKIRIRNFSRPAFGNYKLYIDNYHIDTGEKEKISFPSQNYYFNQLNFFLRVIEGKENNISLNSSRERVNIMEKIYNFAKINRN